MHFEACQTGNAVAVPIMNADGTVTPPMTGADIAKTKQQEKQQGEMGALVVETMRPGGAWSM